MSKDKCIKLRWSVAEKVMRTVKSLAESPAKEILGEKFSNIGGQVHLHVGPKGPKDFQ